MALGCTEGELCLLEYEVRTCFSYTRKHGSIGHMVAIFLGRHVGSEISSVFGRSSSSNGHGSSWHATILYSSASFCTDS